METRKIIEFGKSSHVVSLPKKWMEQNKLSKGDLIRMEEDRDTLTIGPARDYAKQAKKTEIDVTNMDIDAIIIVLISRYIQNYNEIILKSKNMSDKAKEIRQAVHNMMALEVIEETATKIVTKDFLNMEEINPAELIKKMDIITREMLTDMKSAFKEDKGTNIAERDQDVNRLFYLIRRSVRYLPKRSAAMKELALTQDDLNMIWNISSYIERIADQIKRIAKLMNRLKLNEREKKEITVVFTQIEKYYTRAMEMYYTKDTADAVASVLRAKDLMKRCQDYYRANWEADWIPVIIEELKIIVAYTRTIFIDLVDSELVIKE